MSVDPIILKIQADIKGIKSSLDKVQKDSEKTAKKTQDSFEKAFTRIAGRIAAAFAVERIVAFTGEIIKLGQQAKGVRAAFDNLDNPALLSNLRKATRGTVSDLQLMQQAVQAQNLGVPIEQLGTLFQFASQRAAETGESVEFLTNSIVTGLGRKSPLILDNLGVSAIRIKEALGGVSTEQATVNELTAAFASIIQDDMAGAADVGVNQTERLSAAFENFKLVLAEEATPAVDSFAESVAKALEVNTRVIESESIPLWEKFLGVFGQFSTAGSLYLQKLNAISIAEQSRKDIISETVAEIRAYKKAQEEANNPAPVKGLVQALKERKKAIEDEINTTPSRQRLNELLVQQKDVVAQINELLGKNVDLEKEALDVALLRAGEAMLRRAEGGFDTRVEETRTVEDTVTEILAAAQEERLEDLEAYTNEANRLRMTELEAERIKQQGIMSLMNVGFELFKEIAGQSAKDAKALAVFQALINTFQAVTNVLASPLAKTNPVLAGVLAVSTGALGLVQVKKIQSQPEPNFYEGTDFVKSPSKGAKRDDVQANLHHGEAVIPAKANSRLKGFAKAWIDGKENEWLIRNHPALGLINSDKKKESKSTATVGFDDYRLYGQSRKTNKLLEAIAANTKSQRRKLRHG